MADPGSNGDSGPLVRLEHKNARQQRRCSDGQRERAGLIGVDAGSGSGGDSAAPTPLSPLSPAAAAAAEQQGLLPVMLENGLERLGAL